MRHFSGREGIASNRNRLRNLRIMGELPQCPWYTSSLKRRRWNRPARVSDYTVGTTLLVVLFILLFLSGCASFLKNAEDIVHRATDCVFDTDPQKCGEVGRTPSVE